MTGPGAGMIGPEVRNEVVLGHCALYWLIKDNHAGLMLLSDQYDILVIVAMCRGIL